MDGDTNGWRYKIAGDGWEKVEHFQRRFKETKPWEAMVLSIRPCGGPWTGLNEICPIHLNAWL